MALNAISFLVERGFRLPVFPRIDYLQTGN